MKLQEGDMNNWVNLLGSWELQAVGNLVSHGERP